MTATTAMHAYDLLAELIEYPGADLVSTAERCRGELEARGHAEPARAVAAFAEFAAGRDPRELEELYTRTFDLQAPCCLDLGWQLFGEAYNRGPFLVRLRLAERAHGIDPGTELPDHLAPVLRLAARLDAEEEPESLVEEAMLPAISKMVSAFEDAENPYKEILASIARVLSADFHVPPPATHRVVHLPITEGIEP